MMKKRGCTITFVDPSGLDVDLNLFGTNEPIHSFAKNVSNKNGIFQIGVHGNSSHVYPANSRPLNADALAKLIQNDPNYKEGMPVHLLSCETGQGSNPIAQQLADKLNVPVTAPTELLWYGSDGSLTPMGGKYNANRQLIQDTSRPGKMKKFVPKSSSSISKIINHIENMF